MHNDAAVIGGLGVVGRATRMMLGIERYYDLDDKGLTEKELQDTEYLFLCLPTPTVGGVCDTSRIERYFDICGQGHTYIIRSTVVPGTARELAEKYGVPVLSCPEFLTEATADQECRLPDILVFGADDATVQMEVWCKFFHSIRAEKIIFTNTITAEFIKYAVNTFYAAKVIFANALYDAAEQAGVDYDTVKEAMYARKWIGHNHLTVPWKGRRGVDGKCLPKDLEAFATFSGHEFFRFLHTMNTTWTG